MILRDAPSTSSVAPQDERFKVRNVSVFRAADMAAIEVQGSQTAELRWDVALNAGRELEAAGNAFTVRDLAGRIVFCGGASERHAQYATLWGLFSAHRPRVPLWLTRTVRRFVSELPHRRVDCMVQAANIGACGWARLIGLREECLLREACEDGGDMVVFVRPFETATASPPQGEREIVEWR